MIDVTLSLIVLRSKNLDASLDFYQRLGLRFVQEQHGKGPIHYAASLNDTVIELYPQRELGDHVDPTRIGFTINSLQNTFRLLQEIGIEIKSQQPMKAIVNDPDGRVVELVEGISQTRKEV